MKKINSILLLAITILMFSSCSKDKVITLTKIKVETFPDKDYNGVLGEVEWDELDPAGVDPEGDPDIFPSITDDTGITVWELADYRINRFLNAKANSSIEFTCNLVVEEDKQYQARIFDFDEITSNDLMGSVPFSLEGKTIGESETSFDFSSGQTKFTLYFTAK